MRSENVSMYKKLEAEKLYIPSRHTEEMSLVSNQVFYNFILGHTMD